MKKTFLSLLTIGLLVLPIATIAVTITEPVERTGEQTLAVIDTVVSYIFSIFLVIAVLCFVIGAYYFITSAGAPEKVTTARNFVLYGIIGVIIAVLSKGLIALARLIAGA